MFLKEKKCRLYCTPIGNFGDDLNRILFKNLFNKKFQLTENKWNADFIGIGSLLEWFLYPNNFRQIIRTSIRWKVLHPDVKTITVLSSGFHYEPENLHFFRKMIFKIVRGHLTENVLKKNKLLKNNAVLGDLGLLAPYLIKDTVLRKTYELGIVPHFNDLASPVMYDIYKKYKGNSIIINVKDNPIKVIKDIMGCKKIISSSLHGLIVSDAFGIPNLWIENRLKSPQDELHFKYLDYYSVFGIKKKHPIEALNFLEQDIKSIEEDYNISYEMIKQKQKELYEYCKIYLEKV
jgi:pyruvyltransferase